MQVRPASAAKQAVNAAQAPTSQPNSQVSSNSNAAPTPLSSIGVDLEGIMDDDEDDEEVELTEDDWKDPHFLVCQVRTAQWMYAGPGLG